ncbi:MAG: flagellar biosynthetic protein FliQ [Planctomycetes bacterium]|nr:flagellar biosynthetic protein FliQ [Planctomycetota bacterium]
MTIPEVVRLAQDFLGTALMIALPALVVSLVVGLIVSILQTITSIQDQTLSFVPRLLAVGAAMLLCLGWILQTAVHFTARMITSAAEVLR